MDELIAVCRRIEVDYGADGFHGDDPVRPALYLLVRRDNGRLRAYQQAMPDGIWSLPTPAHILAAITEHLRHVPEPVLMRIVTKLPEFAGRFAGAVFAAEAWALGEHDDLTMEELNGVAEHRLIHAHPLRVEVRTVVGVDRELNVVGVTRINGEAGVSVQTSDNRTEARVGNVPQGLIRLVSAVDEMIGAGLFG